MKPLNVELLMGHDSGISESYWRPTELEVLADYLKAVDLLTINDNNSTLQKQVAELTEKSKEENYVIKGKLAEKEKEIKAAAREAEETKKEIEEIKAKMEIFQANVSSYFRTLLPYTGSTQCRRRRLEPVEIIAWNEEESGSEGLFKAAAIARARNEARENKKVTFRRTAKIKAEEPPHSYNNRSKESENNKHKP
jgi:hypothetical protein